VFAVAGDAARGLDLLALGVQRGFTPVAFIETHCPFIAPLRVHAHFATVLAEAQVRSAEVCRSVMAAD
jgi:hypothetical protein